MGAEARGATERVAAVQPPSPPSACDKAKRKQEHKAVETVDGAPAAPLVVRARRRPLATPAATKAPAPTVRQGPGQERQRPEPSGGGGLDTADRAAVAHADALEKFGGAGGNCIGGPRPPRQRLRRLEA